MGVRQGRDITNNFTGEWSDMKSFKSGFFHTGYFWDKDENKESGFTLVELMVVTAMFAIVMTGVMSVLVNFTTSYTFNSIAAEIQNDVRMALYFMERDIRQAGLDKSKQADAGFNANISTKIWFTADINMDDDIDSTDFEEITYWFDNGTKTLRQRLYESTGLANEVVILEDVEACFFVYRDEDDNLTSYGPNIRTVEINLRVIRNATLGRRLDRTYQVKVKCRNMGV